MSSGLIDEKQSVRLGKLLGANAVVVGAVTQYQSLSRNTAPYYEKLPSRCEQDPKCGQNLQSIAMLLGSEKMLEVAKEWNKHEYVLNPGKNWLESFASASLRIIDVETGLVIYSASGYYQKSYTNPPEQLLEFIMQALVNEWTIN